MRRTLCTLAALTLAAPAFAGPHGRGGGPGRMGGPGFDPEAMEERMEHRADRLAELLDLTPEQKAAFQKLRSEEMERAKPKLERMDVAHEELRALLDSGTNDAARVGALVLETHRLKGELKAAKEAVETELVKLLDDEQRFAFDALKESHQGRRDRFRGGRHRGSGGPDDWDAPPPPRG